MPTVSGPRRDKPATGCWAPKAHRCARATKATPSVRTDRRSTVAQVTENFNGGHGRNVSQSQVHHTLLRMGLRSRRSVRVPMITPVHCQKQLQWAREHQNWTLEQWKKVAWSDEPRFLSDHVDGRDRVRRLPGEVMAPGCAVGRRQAGGGSVML